MDRLLRNTVWAKDGISAEDWKYRRLQRVWLPIYDLIAVYSGLMGMFFGSPILTKIFGGDNYAQIDPVDGYTAIFTLVAVACLISVSIPRLWPMEVVSKIALVGMVVGYIFAIVVFGDRGENGLPNLFVTGMLAFGLPLALFRLDLLGQEILDRRLVMEAIDHGEN